MIALRKYQLQTVNDLRAEMRKGHNKIVMQGQTGSGKTIVFTYMVKEASQKGLRCMILTHRMELLEQSGNTFDKIGIDYANITASTRHIPSGRVLVAMIETIKRRAKKRLDFQMLLKSVQLLICDENHRREFDDVFQYLSPDCFVIGATATPIRQGKLKPLSDFFTSLVIGPSIQFLIQDGYLSKPKYFGIPVDLSTVRMKAGEFDENDMTKVYADVKVFEGLRHNLDLHAKNLKTMIFCPSVASSLQVAHELGCLHVDGTMSMVERDRRLTEFENTPGAILTNCGITTTGYDNAEIECIVLYRATTSIALYLQMLGRGSRTTATKKEFVILDFGMNIQRFGFWEIDRKWSLNNVPKRNRNKLDTFPIKFCPQCGAIVSVNCKTCEYCGYVWPVLEKEKVFAELQLLTYAQVQKRMNEAKNVEEMEAIRVARNYKVGYLLYRFKTYEQFKEYERLKNYKKGWSYLQAKRYGVI